MSQTKQKTKIKTSTVAIIALSMILVLSLVATITLAYFTASRNVVTTVKFANGISLQMYGAAFKESDGTYTAGDPDAPPSTQAATLYWLAKSGSGGTMTNNTTIQGGYEDVNDVLEFQNLRIRAVDSDAFIAFKMIVTAFNRSGTEVALSSGIQGFTPPTPTTNWKIFDTTTKGTAGSPDVTYSGTTSATAKNWYVYTGNGSSIAKLPHNNVTADTASTTQGDPQAFELIYGAEPADPTNAPNDYTGYKIPTANSYMNNFAGMTFTFTLVIVASDTQLGLIDMIEGAGTYTVGTGVNERTINKVTCDQYGNTTP